MKAPTWGPNENLTLTEAELNACRPVRGEGGRAIRAFCPFHGSDRQRSLRVDVESGRFQCFACGAWGYMAEARERWRAERLQGKKTARGGRKEAGKGITLGRAPTRLKTPVKAPQPSRDDLDELQAAFQAALPDSLGAEYLRRRGIPLELAQRVGVGYAGPDAWPGRPWRWGRVTFPLTDPAGRIITFYGRAVGAPEKVPKQHRHDILPGDKAYFNGRALAEGAGPLYVTEGVFDALALMAAGVQRVVAIIGAKGWRWDWARDVNELVLALDADETGGKAWRELARQARLRGRQVHFLPAEAYGGHKDPAAAWEAGVLQVTVPAPSPAFTVIESETLGERIAILHDEEAAGPPDLVAFRPSELKLLEGVTPDELRQVYAAKKFWRGLIVKKECQGVAPTVPRRKALRYRTLGRLECSVEEPCRTCDA